MRFRRKLEIEAVQWTGDNTTDVIDWLQATGARSARWHEAVPGVEPDGDGKGRDPNPEHITTDSPGGGAMRATVGDWIVWDGRGMHYACRPDIFASIYEPVKA